MDVKNSVVVVTGGASGMGAATVERFHAAGAKIAILDVTAESGKKMAAKVDGMFISCDVTNTESVTTALQKISTELGDIRICVNCAGILYARRMINKEGPTPLAEFRKIIDVNLIGTFNVMQSVAAKMINAKPLNESGERGVIINTASIAAFEGQIGQTAYSASKGGIVSLTLPAARELAKFGIRVMAIAPGLVDTPMFASLSEAARQGFAASVPFPARLAKPSEFADLALAIAQNPMLNGTVIRLDGALRLPPK